MLFGFLYAQDRYFMVKFPLDLLVVFLYSYALIGAAAGLLFQDYFAGKGKRWLIIAAPVISLGVLINQEVSFHFLLFNTYYTYLVPKAMWIFMSLLLAAVILLPTVPCYLTSRIRLQSLRDLLILFLGGSVGLCASFLLVTTFGAPLVMLSFIALIFFRERLAFTAVIGLAVLSPFAFTHKSFQVWRVGEYRTLSSHWTPYYRVHFVSFRDDSCYGAVHNNVMLWYVCQDPLLLENEIRQFQRAFAPFAKDVLNLGRVDGVYPLTLKHHGAQLSSVLAADVDPVVEQLARTRYAKYNNFFYQSERFQTISGDYRRIMETRKKKYDLVYFAGIAIRLYTFPLSIVPYENYMYTKESYQTVFNKLLKEDGVLVIDFGSSVRQEAYSLMANMPEDVHVRGYWASFSNWPFMGSPVHFVFASRSRQRMQHLDQVMSEIANITPVAMPPRSQLYTYDDSRPYVQRNLFVLLLLVSSPLLLVFFGSALLLQRAGKLLAVPTLQGLLFGFFLAYALSRDTRYLLAGPAYAHLFVAAEIFALLLLGSLFAKIGRPRLVSLAVALLLIVHQGANNPAALLLLAPLAVLYGALLQMAPPPSLGLFFFGLAAGIYAFQFILVIGGYWMAAITLSLLIPFLTFELRETEITSPARA